MPDWQRKAEAESLLRRANADVRPVRVRGYVPPEERVRWSALRLEKRIMRSGVWQRLAMNEAGLSEEQPLELLRSLPEKSGVLETFAIDVSHGSDGATVRLKAVPQDARLWRRLRPDDVGEVAAEDAPEVRILDLNDVAFQLLHGWYLVPDEPHLDLDEALPTPSVKQGVPMLLVRPFSFLRSSVVSPFGASDVGSLGIGTELFFTQLASLAIAFLVMGVLSLTEIMKNIYAYSEKLDFSNLKDVPWTELFLVGSTLGAQDGPHATMTLFGGGMNVLASSAIFAIYLIWLDRFNTQRARITQQTAMTAADYTVAVSGLSKLPEGQRPATDNDVADLFAKELIKSWHRRRKRSVSVKVRRHLELKTSHICLGSIAA